MPANNSPHLVEPGDRFERLVVIEFSHNDKRHRRHYIVKCDCGNTKTVQGTLLRSGNTRSCGCLARDAKKAKTLPENRGVVNQIILQYKRHAKSRGIEFFLTYKEVDELVRKPCEYCGDVGGNVKKTKNYKEGFRYNGIDRVDSSGQYTSNNVVPCCAICNRAKRDMPRAAFLEWVDRVAKHQAAFASQWGEDLTHNVEVRG